MSASNKCPFFGEKSVCFLGAGSNFRFGHSERSRGIWPTIVRVFPFEAGFLRYVMLRITSVGMTKCSHAFFGEESVDFSGAIRRFARQSQSLRQDFFSSALAIRVTQNNCELRRPIILGKICSLGKKWEFPAFSYCISFTDCLSLQY